VTDEDGCSSSFPLSPTSSSLGDCERRRRRRKEARVRSVHSSPLHVSHRALLLEAGPRGQPPAAILGMLQVPPHGCQPLGCQLSPLGLPLPPQGGRPHLLAAAAPLPLKHEVKVILFKIIKYFPILIVV
jgi:hypothetical protein